MRVDRACCHRAKSLPSDSCIGQIGTRVIVPDITACLVFSMGSIVEAIKGAQVGSSKPKRTFG